MDPAVIPSLKVEVLVTDIELEEPIPEPVATGSSASRKKRKTGMIGHHKRGKVEPIQDVTAGKPGGSL